MKHSSPSRNITALAAMALAAVGLVLSSGAAFAQTTKTLKGIFHSSDGNNGTFVETETTNGDSKTDDIIFTRRSDKKTSTDITTIVTDTTTHSRTISYSHTDFGATAEFTSNKTINKVKGGFYGSGTYTTAAGVTGTVRTLETSAGDVNVDSNAYLPASGTGSNDLRVEEEALGFRAVRTLAVGPDGKTTSTINTRTFRD